MTSQYHKLLMLNYVRRRKINKGQKKKKRVEKEERARRYHVSTRKKDMHLRQHWKNRLAWLAALGIGISRPLPGLSPCALDSLAQWKLTRRTWYCRHNLMGGSDKLPPCHLAIVLGGFQLLELFDMLVVLSQIPHLRGCELLYIFFSLL